MCGEPACAFNASRSWYFSTTMNVSGPSAAWNLSTGSESIAAPYSMQPGSARTFGTLARNARSTCSRMPGLAVMTAITWIIFRSPVGKWVRMKSSSFGARRCSARRAADRFGWKRGCAGGLLHGDRARRETDALLAEHPVDALERFALPPARLRRPRTELHPHDERIVGDVGHALQFERLQQLRAELRFLHHLHADLLHGLAHELDVGVACEPHVELDRLPVAAEVGDRGELAERDRVDLAVVVAQPHRAQGDLLHRALELPRIDVFPDTERVVGHEEDPGDDVAHQRLRADTDREADDARAGKERRDVDAK